MPYRPEPTTRADLALLASMQGARLSGVTYHDSPIADGADFAGAAEGLDADLEAVELDLGRDGTVLVTWAMAGHSEGLAVVEDEPYGGRSSKALASADRPTWSRCTGESISSVAASWHVPVADGSPCLWSLRLDFGETSIVIALGEDHPRLQYVANGLVVLFDESLARSYRPPGASESAWGISVTQS